MRVTTVAQPPVGSSPRPPAAVAPAVQDRRAAADVQNMATTTNSTGQVERHRLVTRSDFDGLVCAALLKQLGMLDDILFVHPKDMQDGKVELTDRDITTNLPYVPGVHLAFDHHDSELERVDGSPENHVISVEAKSAARVVYDHFGGAERFAQVSDELMEAVDKADAAEFSEDEILDPAGWIFLSFLMDPRTGLGRFRDFRISNYQLMMQLIDACTQLSADEVLASPDVAERVELYWAHADAAREQILRCATVHGNLVVLDLRGEEIIHPTNRFQIYALFPQCSISVHVLWGLKQQNTVFAVGKSIIDRSSATNVGALMLEYGGGGHEAAGTCQVENADAAAVQAELVARINADGVRS
jgi:nanoRNase/pAp phosphatase (c-di-AMP/oligoRNAs hydrolase)